MELVTTVSPLAVSGLTAIGVIACALSLVVLARTCAEHETLALAVSRRLLPVPALAVAALAFSLDWGPLAKATNSFAVLIGLEALAIAFATPASVRRLARMRERDGQPAWWPRLERDFRGYAATSAAGRERERS